MSRILLAPRGVYGLIACLALISIKTVIDLSLGGTSNRADFSSDLFNQWVPLYQFIRDSVALGQVPLWNPYVAIGTPLVAELGLGLFNPMTWPVFIFDAPLALFITQFVSILTAVISMWLFLGHLKLEDSARIPGSILFGLIVLTNSFLPSAGLSLSILPLILLTTSKLIDQPRFRTTAILSLLLAMCFFSGMPNYFYYTGLLIGSYSLALCALRHEKAAGFNTLLRLGLLAISVLLMLFLVGVQLLPTYELSRLSIRDVASDINSNTLQELMQADLGLLLRNFFSAHSFNLYSIKLFVVDEGLGYLSALPAFFGLALLDRQNRKVVFALLFSMIFMLLFLAAEQFDALGFMRALPMASTLRWNGRISDYIQVVVVVLSAIGLSAFLQAVFRDTTHSDASTLRRYRIYLPPVLLFQIFLVYYWNDASAAFWCVTLISCLLVLLAFRNQPNKWAVFLVPAVVLLLSADVLVHRKNAFLTPFFAAENNPFFEATKDPALRSRVEKIAHEHPDSRMLIYNKGPAFGYSVANIGLIFRVPNINAYTGFTLASWKNYLSTMVGKEVFDQAISRTPLQAFMGTLNSSLLRELEENESILAIAAVSHFVSAKETRPIDKAFPRTFLTNDYSVAEDSAYALELIRNKLGTRGPWVVLDKAPQTLPQSTQPVEGEVDIVAYQNDRVIINASLSLPGLMVLNDAYYPGWQALVDGKKTEILRANTLFRAVALEKGQHTVEFVYRPLSLYLGASLSLLGLVAALLLMYERRRQT